MISLISKNVEKVDTFDFLEIAKPKQIIPKDIVRYILSFHTSYDLIKAGHISKIFMITRNENGMWKDRFETDFKDFTLNKDISFFSQYLEQFRIAQNWKLNRFKKTSFEFERGVSSHKKVLINNNKIVELTKENSIVIIDIESAQTEFTLKEVGFDYINDASIRGDYLILTCRYEKPCFFESQVWNLKEGKNIFKKLSDTDIAFDNDCFILNSIIDQSSLIEVYALKDGSLQYTIEQPVLRYALAIYKNYIITGDQFGILRAYDKKSGDLKLEKMIMKSSPISKIINQDDQLFINFNSKQLVILDGNTFDITHSIENDINVFCNLSFVYKDEKSIYTIYETFQNNIVDKVLKIWSLKDNKFTSKIDSNDHILWDNKRIISIHSNKITLYDKTTLDPSTWEFEQKESPIDLISVDKRHIYIRRNYKNLVVYNKFTGQKVKEFNNTSIAFFSPLNDRLVVCTSDNKVEILDFENKIETTDISEKSEQSQLFK